MYNYNTVWLEATVAIATGHAIKVFNDLYYSNDVGLLA
jgi:hypothetical protein